MFYHLTYRFLAFSEVNLPHEVLIPSSQSSRVRPAADSLGLFPLQGGRAHSMGSPVGASGSGCQKGLPGLGLVLHLEDGFKGRQILLWVGCSQDNSEFF